VGRQESVTKKELRIEIDNECRGGMSDLSWIEERRKRMTEKGGTEEKHNVAGSASYINYGSCQ